MNGKPERGPRFPARWDRAEPARSLGRLRAVPKVAQAALHRAGSGPTSVAGVSAPAPRPAGPGIFAHSPRMGWPTPLQPEGVGLDSAAVRDAMVQRLAMHGLQHPAVLGAMRHVPRHRFVDTALVAQAYEDTALPIGWEQTISKPSIVARMVELLCAAPCARADAVRPLAGRVLEIGTGCGYQAAVLAQVATEVYSIERVRGLHERARANVRSLQLANLQLILGDGMQGYAAGGPYAAIISAAGGADVPAAWLAQLAMGGRLIAPTEVLDAHGRMQQALVVVDRTAQGLQQRVLETVQFVPLKSGIESHGRL
jgi:protein-L-isoaspartate(D-aspartate) O-methyltransferase